MRFFLAPLFTLILAALVVANLIPEQDAKRGAEFINPPDNKRAE
jgi:hypothetical protein